MNRIIEEELKENNSVSSPNKTNRANNLEFYLLSSSDCKINNESCCYSFVENDENMLMNNPQDENNNSQNIVTNPGTPLKDSKLKLNSNKYQKRLTVVQNKNVHFCVNKSKFSSPDRDIKHSPLKDKEKDQPCFLFNKNFLLGSNVSIEDKVKLKHKQIDNIFNNPPIYDYPPIEFHDHKVSIWRKLANDITSPFHDVKYYQMFIKTQQEKEMMYLQK